MSPSKTIRPCIDCEAPTDTGYLCPDCQRFWDESKAEADAWYLQQTEYLEGGWWLPLETAASGVTDPETLAPALAEINRLHEILKFITWRADAARHAGKRQVNRD